MFHSRWAALISASVCACTAPMTRPDASAMNDASADAVMQGTDGGDASSDAATPEQTIRALLDDPAPLQHATEIPFFGDEAIEGIRAGVSAPRAFNETPSAEGIMRDRTEDLPGVRALADGRGHSATLHISVSGGRNTRTMGSVALDVGAIVPRRVRELEAGDEFVARGRGALPPTPAALRTLEFSSQTAEDDSDEFEAVALLGTATDAMLTVSFGGSTATLSLSSGEPAFITLDDGRSLTVTAAVDPAGACVTSRTRVRADAVATNTGVIGLFRGVVIEQGRVVGAVRGVFGKNSAGREIARVQVIHADGSLRFTGGAVGAISPIATVGRLRANGSPAGTFTLRGEIHPEGPSAALALELHTDCR